ncbi:MAG: PEP/pyruvate-binding domain-containing protein [Sciscionella sp.]
MRTLGQRDLVVALHATTKTDAARVGRKAATLGVLTRAGLAVPEGLVLTAEAAEDGSSATLPDDVEAAIRSIAAHFGRGLLAVRSSSVAEDTPDASYAGQYETVLHVVGLDALRAAIRSCWASARSERVRAYQRARGKAGTPPIAVLVQRQVDADVAGVAFSANPVSGARHEVLVSAVPGLGDTLVNGERQPDEWVVTGQVATAVRVPHQALAEPQAKAVAALARRVESLLGGPQDVEWAMADGKLLVLQARPITALPRQPVVDLPPGTWVKDAARYPEPMTALGASLAVPSVVAGLSTMFATYGGLIDRMEARVVGGEMYARMVPVGGKDGSAPPWWLLGVLARVARPLRSRMRAARRMVRAEVLDGLVQRWHTGWRPEFEETTSALRAVELADLDDGELDTHLARLVELARRQLAVHFELTAPHVIEVHALVETCARLLGWDAAQALELLAGTSTTSSEPGRVLTELAERIGGDPRATSAVKSAGADIAQRLTDADPALGAAFHNWIQSYGLRCVNDDPGSPVLAERPLLLATLLRDALAARQRPVGTAARQAEQALTRARSQLASHPAADRAGFERALAAASRSYPVREETTFWLASVSGLVRLTAMEAGKRLLARGLVERPDDAMHLDLDALRAALSGAATTDLRTCIARTRAERAWVMLHPGPPFYGPKPTTPPDLRWLPRPAREFNAAMMWTQGLTTTADSEAAPARATLTGVAGSPGRYTGPVRVVRGEADFAGLRSGDVLVCPTTDPAWSLLFGLAGALITDGGGVLSHAAIVAREYAIPAVLGTSAATRVLHDGDVVTVDGGTGLVHLERHGSTLP